MVIGIIIGVIVVVALVYIVVTYNRFVRLNNRVENAWAQVHVQLQRRYDLVPNLIETVKGYAAHETELIERVTATRTAAMNAHGKVDQLRANVQLTQDIRTLFAVAENYPQLRANENFLNLQDQLADCENRISHMRQSFNDTVMKYNTAIATIPAVFVAVAFKFTGYELYASDPASDDVPRVEF